MLPIMNELDELTQIDSQVKVTHVDRDEWDLSQECEHNVLLNLIYVSLLVRKGTRF